MDNMQNDIEDIKYMAQTKELINNMTKKLADDKVGKNDIALDLADTKIAMFKEDEALRRKVVELETNLVSTRAQLEKSRRDNIDLVDRISAQQDLPNILEPNKVQEDLEHENKLKERQAEYERLINQDFSLESAEKYMIAKYGADWKS